MSGAFAMRPSAVFSAIWRDVAGATAIEYAFIAVLISTVAIAAMNSIGGWTADTFASLASSL
jgi:Flp pilus assembly pilin Flp